MAIAATAPDAKMYIQLPEETTSRVLHACTVDDVDGATRRLVAAEPIPGLMPDETALVFFEQRREFMQQTATVRAVETGSEGEFAVELELVGKPASAEQRQSYRVSCVVTDIEATFDGEPGCNVVDVSATGFGLYSTRSCQIGQTVDARVHYAGETHAGRVTVQSAWRISPSTIRYGVRTLESEDREQTLHKSLNRINLAIQREQMRRLA